MKLRASTLMLLLGTGAALAQFPPQIKNVVIIFQENRTPDNLFHFLAPACLLGPSSEGMDACTPAMVNANCYNISPCGLSNETGTVVPVTLKPLPLSGTIDPDHSHNGFENMCDPDPATLECRNDGAWLTSKPAGSSYSYVSNRPVTNYDGTKGHLLDPYLTLATRYGWANFMFQTNQGPSYPAHQFMFSGTSAPTAADDANATFISENFNMKIIGNEAGCISPKNTTNFLISPAISTPPPACTLYDDSSVQECPMDNTALVYPTDPVGSFCYPHKSMASLLNPPAITWRYYSPAPGSIWTAPDSIKEICEPAFVHPNGDPTSKLECTGTQWKANVDLLHHGADVLRDIDNCALAHVSWVIPDGAWSDHAGAHDQYGPSWVAAIVNAIGTRAKCGKGTEDEGQTFWDDTAIIITWDDWGGWSDHVPAHYLSKLPCKSTDCEGDYQHGFRVPLIVVSAYTPSGYISNNEHNFGSVLRMIEGIFSLGEGALGFADARSGSDLHEFFTLTAPRNYTAIPAVKDGHFFLTYTAAPINPDDD
jgi:phospholipase C